MACRWDLSGRLRNQQLAGDRAESLSLGALKISSLVCYICRLDEVSREVVLVPKKNTHQCLLPSLCQSHYGVCSRPDFVLVKEKVGCSTWTRCCCCRTVSLTCLRL